MCISAEALALFLNLLSHDIIEVKADQIVVHATTQEAIWTVGADDQWCVERPLQYAKSDKS